MTETVKAWQCIGCGKLEAPQTCIGICQDRKVELVYANDHREALARAHAQTGAMELLVRHIAWTTPREGEWERSYRALQVRARRALAQASGVVVP